MKKLGIVAAAVALGLAIVAGILWGPRLWFRLTGTTTPLGRIESVKRVDTFPEGGGYGSVSANAGHQLWVVAFSGKGRSSAASSDDKKPTVVLDETGTTYEMAMMQITINQDGTGSGAALVFSLPEGRVPRSIRFGDSAPIALP